jgi:putative ABC transport system permease protein
VLGARGSELQLVLNTVYHLDTSPGNIPWTLYRDVKHDRLVKWAIPYAVGDNYRGFRVVGTTPEIFSDFEYVRGRKLALAQGRKFDPDKREAVLGSFVAEQTGLVYNAKFPVYHGVVFNEAEKHEGEYTVCGILEPTGTPVDRVVWIPIDGIFMMDRHVLRGAGEEYRPEHGKAIPDEHKEVGAVLLKFRGGAAAGWQFKERVQRGNRATLAWPIEGSIRQLFEKLGWVTRVLAMVAYLVVAVAVGGILASLYNTMNERRREFAILRALGAARARVFSVIVAEAATIAAIGALLGFLVYGVILAAATALLRQRTGVVLDVFAPHPVLWIAPLGMLLLGAVAGLLPAWKAYATDVADNLAPAT